MSRCTYPECKCPFDAPADPNWCAKGLPKFEEPETFPVIDNITTETRIYPDFQAAFSVISKPLRQIITKQIGVLAEQKKYDEAQNLLDCLREVKE